MGYKPSVGRAVNTLDRSPEEAAEGTPVESLDDDRIRALLPKLDEDIAGWRAKLSLLLNTAVQYELDKVDGSDGLRVIASVASMSPSTLSKLLAGDYRPTPKTCSNKPPTRPVSAPPS